MKRYFLVQGSYNETVLELINVLLEIDESSKIMFSHYINEKKIKNSLTNPRFSEFLINDPGPDNLSSDINLKSTNIFRMIKTNFGCDTYQFIKKGIIYKLRSDLIISSKEKFLKSINKIENLFLEKKELELVCLQNGTFNPYGLYKYPFHFNDWFYAVRSERFQELEKYFYYIDKSSLKLDYYLYHDRGKAAKLDKYISRFQAEQYIHFADRFENYEMIEGSIFNKNTLIFFRDYLRRHLWVLPISQTGLKLFKRSLGIGLAHKFSSISEIDILIIRSFPKRLSSLYLIFSGRIKLFFWYPINLIDKIMRRLKFID